MDCAQTLIAFYPVKKIY